MNMSIEIVNGKIFVEGRETVSPMEIGYALIDFAETLEEDNMKIVLRDQDVFVEPFLSQRG